MQANENYKVSNAIYVVLELKKSLFLPALFAPMLSHQYLHHHQRHPYNAYMESITQSICNSYHCSASIISWYMLLVDVSDG